MTRPGERTPAGRLELAAAGLTLLMFSEAFLPRLLAPDAAEMASDDKFLRYLWLPFYALVATGLWRAGGAVLAAAARAPFLILLCLLAMASTLWSIDPDMTLRRSIAVLMTTLLGVYLAARFDWLTALRLLGAVWLALMTASLIAGIVAPGFAVMTETHPGAWSGGWWEKNELGGHAARSSFLFAFLAWRDAPRRRVWIPGLIIALALVVLSTSATALLGALVGVGVIVAAWWMVKGKRLALAFLWAGAVVGGGAGLLLAVAPEVLLALIGREPSLTGRTDIWAELVAAISQKPALGHGYLAFWGPESEPRYWLRKAVSWDAPSGHNGWLDLAVGLGLVGAALFAADVLCNIWRSLSLAMRSPSGVFAIGFLAQFLLFAMSESIVLAQNSILWATYAMVSAKLALEAGAIRTTAQGQGALWPPRNQSMMPHSAAASEGAARTAP
jgi:exopolysaccharide production protein ExoQ